MHEIHQRARKTLLCSRQFRINKQRIWASMHALTPKFASNVTCRKLRHFPVRFGHLSQATELFSPHQLKPNALQIQDIYRTAHLPFLPQYSNLKYCTQTTTFWLLTFQECNRITSPASIALLLLAQRHLVENDSSQVDRSETSLTPATKRNMFVLQMNEKFYFVALIATTRYVTAKQEYFTELTHVSTGEQVFAL